MSEGRLVTDFLNEVDYDDDPNYVPSTFAVKYVNFIKLVNGVEGESHPTPVAHLKMLDQLAGSYGRVANLCCRGSGKTAVFSEYLVLYIATFGVIEGFGEVSGMIYVSDSVENGVKSLRKNVEFRYQKSEFLQTYVPKAKFTDVFMEFTNASGHRFGTKSFGAQSGLRGTKIYGKRPVLAVLDDLVSDSDAKSPTVMESIKDTVYKGVDYALDPTRKKVVFSGTPFNKNDILYQAVESGAWKVNVFPVCERFPCSREEFKSMWPERFTYEYVSEQYNTAKATGELRSFNQELMLQIVSEEDKLVPDDAIQWYNVKDLLSNRAYYNFYITTDFATSEKKHADYSVISVWAYSNNGDWFFVDGVCKKQLMDVNMGDLFSLVNRYKPLGVGVEVTGQQGGFIQWIQREMILRNEFFTLTKDGKGTSPGIRPVNDKMSRFHTVLPQILMGKFFFPRELKDTPWVVEAIEELSFVTAEGMKSKHDDVLDTMSMLTEMKPWKPSDKETESTSSTTQAGYNDGFFKRMWDDDEDENNGTEERYVC